MDSNRMSRDVRYRCPYCGETSFAVNPDDWFSVKKRDLDVWWGNHRVRHMFDPIVETVDE